jgi:REP element-mobilizing transposase RayT
MIPPTLLFCEQYYHLFNHAVGNENLFRKSENYFFFLKKYSHHIEPVADTFAYCLMPNHFHVLIRVKEKEAIQQAILSKKTTKDPNFISEGVHLTDEQCIRFVSKSFANLFSSYTQAYNKVYDRRGNLFISNFKRKPIESEAYFTNALYYIHHNPTHHGFCRDWRDWRFSSYHALIAQKPTQLKRDEVLTWFGGESYFKQFHLQYLSANDLEPVSLEL